MNNPFQKKLAEKVATSRPTQEQNALTDGTDRQINEVRDNAIHKDGDSMRGDFQVYSAGTPDTEHSATPKAWVDDRSNLARDQAKNYADDTFSPLGHLHDSRYYTHGQVDSFLSGKSNVGHGHSCSTELGGINAHNHSISFTPFMKYPKGIRDAMLAQRAILDTPAGLSHEFSEEAFHRLVHHAQMLQENLRIAMALLMDYLSFSAYERERRFADPEWAEWSEDYKRVYGVDEYLQSDMADYILKDGKRMHPHTAFEHVNHDA